jgi:hypothetical protein
MKRLSFVSNSSSASFLVTFRSSLEDKVVKKLCEEAGLFSTSKNGNVYTINTDTMMFNDYRDLPGWKLIRALWFGAIPNTNVINMSTDCEEDEKDFRAYVVQTFDDYDEREKSYAVKYEREYFDYLKFMYELVD